MAEEGDKQDKTESATPKRRDDAREQGQVAMSQDAVSATALIGAAIVLVIGGRLLAIHAGEMIENSCLGLGALSVQDFSAPEWALIITDTARALFLPTIVIVVPLLLVVLAASYAQVGLQVTPKAIAWNPSKLNPIQGWSKVFSTRGAVRTATSLTKTTIVTVTTAGMAWHDVPAIAGLAGSELGPVLAAMGKVFTHCAMAALIAIAAVALFDLLYQRWQHERDLRMSRKDVQEEMKSTDGDPHVKARIRGIQREMARRRMMSEVPKATVVITNPTHFAVALRYDRTTDETSGRAPVLVAKGVDDVAQKIKSVARAAGVPLHEDVLLARAIHAQVEIGQEIPEALFQAVAGVLAYVYRIQGRATVEAGVDA
jgi:flagellar biosynthetic protein FlhB